MIAKSLCVFFSSLITLAVITPAQSSFYEGKTITIIQGRDAGDAGDMRVKAMVPFLQKHIPGNPAIVSEYMPGGGGRKAANHIFKVAKPDGLMIANIGSGFISTAILGETGVQYDIDKFTYLVRPTAPLITCSLPKRISNWAAWKSSERPRGFASALRLWAIRSTSWDAFLPGFSR
jgi:tripartite-type tricarboxylate transporter receptor subunit TctC